MNDELDRHQQADHPEPGGGPLKEYDSTQQQRYQPGEYQPALTLFPFHLKSHNDAQDTHSEHSGAIH
jgi:hypothetical protein